VRSLLGPDHRLDRIGRAQTSPPHPTAKTGKHAGGDDPPRCTVDKPAIQQLLGFGPGRILPTTSS